MPRRGRGTRPKRLARVRAYDAAHIERILAPVKAKPVEGAKEDGETRNAPAATGT